MAARAKTKTVPPKKTPNTVPTSAELRAVEMFRALELQLGREPTFAEVSAALNVSRTMAFKHFESLERKGVMRRATVMRPVEGWKVTEEGERWLPAKPTTKAS